MDLQLAATQFYVTIGVLTAVAAIVSAEVRQAQSLRPASTAMNGTALLLLAGMWICISQIMLMMVFQNSYELMSALAVFHFLAHSVSLVIMATLVVAWYRSIAQHRETDAGMPTPPIHSNSSGP